MPKLDKRGKITIPKHIRDSLGISAGMKTEIKYENKKIIIIPYCYKCQDCGADIPEGTRSSWCARCQEKYTIYIY